MTMKYIFLILIAFGGCLFAQDPGQWVAKGFLFPTGDPLHPTGTILDGKNRILEQLPSLKAQANAGLALPARPFHALGAFHQGLLSRGKETGRVVSRLYRLERDQWQLEAELDYPKDRGLLRLLPCGENRYLGISTRDLREPLPSSGGSPFSLLHRNADNTLQVGSVIDPKCSELAKGGSPYGRAGLGKLVFTDHHATLMDLDSGLYWIFRLDKAQLAHHGRLYAKVSDQLLKADQVRKTILGIHPTPDGDLLIMARLEEVVVAGTPDPMKQAQTYLAQPGADPDHGFRLASEGQRQLVDRNPLVKWFRLDPETGALKVLPLPPPGGSEVLEAEQGYAWRPLPDGTLKMGPVTPRDPEPNRP